MTRPIRPPVAFANKVTKWWSILRVLGNHPKDVEVFWGAICLLSHDIAQVQRYTDFCKEDIDRAGGRFEDPSRFSQFFSVMYCIEKELTLWHK